MSASLFCNVLGWLLRPNHSRLLSSEDTRLMAKYSSSTTGEYSCVQVVPNAGCVLRDTPIQVGCRGPRRICLLQWQAAKRILVWTRPTFRTSGRVCPKHLLHMNMTAALFVEVVQCKLSNMGRRASIVNSFFVLILWRHQLSCVR
jgi:hypothetical protein